MKILKSLSDLNPSEFPDYKESIGNGTSGIDVQEEMKKIDLSNIPSDYRNGSRNPSILRYDFGKFYAYMINYYKGCYYGSLDYDNGYELATTSLKLRKKDDESIILTKKGNTKVKLSIKKKDRIEDVINLILKHY